MIRVEPLERRSLEAARAVLAESCAFEKGAAMVAEEKLFGPSLEAGWAAGAWDGQRLDGVASGGGRFLRLIAVRPDARTRGAGAALLRHALDCARVAEAKVLRAGDEPGNYLAPGVDERDMETIAWLERRGFSHAGNHHNLLVTLDEVRLDAGALARNAAKNGYEIRRAGAADATALAEAAGSFAKAWALEVARSDVHLALKDGVIAAFAAHDGNNRGLGWFGPAGTLATYRRQGLGRTLLAACLAEIHAAGNTHAEIAWAGAAEFYAETLGSTRERRFVTLEKRL